MFLSLVYVVGGLALLVFASDRLVASAVRVSRAIGISAVLIGAIVVGLGTSLPELLVSALSARAGELDIAMANVVGSNAANVTLVLGSAALVAPIVSQVAVLKREGVTMFVAVVLFSLVVLDGEVTRTEGLGLLIGMALALGLLIRWSQNHETPMVAAELGEYPADDDVVTSREVGLGLGALLATIVSAQFLLTGAEDIGLRLGLSATFLGVMLGIGTSLPELATTLAAVRHGSSELVIGNVVGSNLFNSLAVAGVAGVVGPARLLDLAVPEVVFMIGAVAVAGVFAALGRVHRIAGSVLLAGFVALMILSQ